MTYDEKIRMLSVGHVVRFSDDNGNLVYGHIIGFVLENGFPMNIGVDVDVFGEDYILTLDEIEV